MNWVVISDEVTALGWRLAGAQALIADPYSVQERFAEAQQHADLVLISADLAERLPKSAFNAALLAQKPLIAIIAGLTSGAEPPDLEQATKHVLGIGL